MRYFILSLSLLFFSCNFSSEKNEIKPVSVSISENQEVPATYIVKTIIYSKDSLPISADIYEVSSKKPIILLCHQAGYSRGEYKDTALKLMELGFSCMAIDQRSGKEANGVINETALAAKKRNLPTTYLDASQDIEAAIDYLYEINGHKPIILVGSSYSASLALLIGNTSTKVKAIVSFSPGEYFRTTNIQSEIKNLSKPVFVTSSKKESQALEELVSLIDTSYVTHFIPNVQGIHGSRALWSSTEGNEDYWDALSTFIKKN